MHKYSTPVSYVNTHLVHVYVCTVYTSTDVLVQMSESLKDILSVSDQLETEYFSVAYLSASPTLKTLLLSMCQEFYL